MIHESQYPPKPAGMSNINYCWLKASYDVKNGTGVECTPENVHELLLEESCNMKYGPAAVAEVRLKYNDLANQFNKADLIKLAKGRLITDKNLLFDYKFGDNSTQTSHATSKVIDFVESPDDSDICSAGSKHPKLCKPVHKKILSISTGSEMFDFDHNQELLHDPEVLDSITGTTLATIGNDVISDCNNHNVNNLDKPSNSTINISASILELYQEWITSTKS